MKIPFLSILEETVLELKLMKIKTIGILATETAVKDKLYDDILRKNDINFLYPTRAEQNSINKIITELLNGKKMKSQEKKLKTICASLNKKGVDAILLACTDLQIITSNIHISRPILDTTEIIIHATMREFKK